MNEKKPAAQGTAVEDAETPEDKRPGGDKKVPARKETGGPLGPEPTRYGDWERNGRCVDF